MNKEKYIAKKNIKNILIGIGFILLSIVFFSVFFIGIIFVSPNTSDYNQGEILFISFSFTMLFFGMIFSLLIAGEYFKTHEGDAEK